MCEDAEEMESVEWVRAAEECVCEGVEHGIVRKYGSVEVWKCMKMWEEGL